MKRAIVTGATRGIGLAIARRLARNGYEIMMISKDPPKEGNLPGTFHHIADFRYEPVFWAPELKHALANAGWDKVDVLINNAGIAKAVKIEDTELRDFYDMLHVNLIAPFHLTKMVIPLLRANGGGSIVNISSISGLTGFSTMGAYCATKFGLNGFGLVAAKELAKDKIRVNNVCPGPTDTDMWSDLDSEYRQINGWETDEQSEQAYMSKLLIKRMGHVEDVASAVEFLVDENRASYITGTNFKVCGGNLIG